jgi:hypothetical protein
MPVSYRIRGPVVEGKTDPVMARIVRDVDRAVADDLRDTWFKILKSHVRHWTGAYGRRITVKHTAKQSVVTDQGVVYGPWLEGTGKRNRATRFKGYHALRQAKEQNKRRAQQIAERVVNTHMSELGGQ